MSILNDHKLDVSSVMLDLNSTPRISNKAFFKEALDLMDANRLGIVCITDDSDKLDGIITDGDIRRMLIRVQKPLAALFSDDVISYAIKTPITINGSTSVTEAIAIMGSKKIWDLPVVNKDKELIGLLHLHPAIEAIMGGGDVRKMS